MDTRTGQIKEYAPTDTIPPHYIELTKAQVDHLLSLPEGERVAEFNRLYGDDAVIVDPSMEMDSESLSERIAKFQGVGVGPFQRLKEPPDDYSDYKAARPDDGRTPGCGSRFEFFKGRFKRRK